MVMGTFKNLYVFNFAILLKSHRRHTSLHVCVIRQLQKQTT